MASASELHPAAVPAIETQSCLMILAVISIWAAIHTVPTIAYVAHNLIRWFKDVETSHGFVQVLLLFNILVANLLQSLSYSLSFYWLRTKELVSMSSMCKVQGYISMMGDLASVFFVCATALCTANSVLWYFPVSNRAVGWSIGALWLFAAVMPSIGYALHPEYFFALNGSWCWANPHYRLDVMFLHDIWMILGVLATFTLYGFIWRSIIKTRRKITSAMDSGNSRMNFISLEREQKNWNGMTRADLIMIICPVAYLTLNLPLVVIRIVSSYHPQKFIVTCFGGAIIACSGLVNSLVYGYLRRSVLRSHRSRDKKRFGNYIPKRWTKESGTSGSRTSTNVAYHTGGPDDLPDLVFRTGDPADMVDSPFHTSGPTTDGLDKLCMQHGIPLQSLRSEPNVSFRDSVAKKPRVINPFDDDVFVIGDEDNTSMDESSFKYDGRYDSIGASTLVGDKRTSNPFTTTPSEGTRASNPFSTISSTDERMSSNPFINIMPADQRVSNHFSTTSSTDKRTSSNPFRTSQIVSPAAASTPEPSSAMSGIGLLRGYSGANMGSAMLTPPRVSGNTLISLTGTPIITPTPAPRRFVNRPIATPVPSPNFPRELVWSKIGMKRAEEKKENDVKGGKKWISDARDVV
ncbi:hypothetical protein EJ06DRAFT_549038 [Trichodelitschia bisporula]|uniref:G-protein coupled receptors family 1 profile domain-containing protein n=1 Tax=Trichodelitschia bisporula TaxID=703511 RepID=A0A6G1HWV2_9PEZI|nr:hypothetical protein EJ06DRAFT_549038 [Trichodelitschia bisporula]